MGGKLQLTSRQERYLFLELRKMTNFETIMFLKYSVPSNVDWQMNIRKVRSLKYKIGLFLARKLKQNERVKAEYDSTM